MSATTSIEWTHNDSDTWRPVPTHAGYFASRDGRLIGPDGGVLRPMAQKTGHLYVLTPLPRRPRKLFVHRAVLLAWAGEPPAPGAHCRHLDGDPTNNSLSNLAWGTHVENMRDKARHGTERQGQDKANARITNAQAVAIRTDRRAARVIGAEYGISHTTVLKIRRGERWKSVA